MYLMITVFLDHLKPVCLPLAILKPLEECARAQSISQRVDAGQLTVPLLTATNHIESYKGHA